MISKEFEIDKEVYIHRAELMEFYNTPEGIKELSSWILLSGLLSDITSESQKVAHNMVVRKLEEIGVLDEEGLEDLVKYLLSRGSCKRPREEN